MKRLLVALLLSGLGLLNTSTGVSAWTRGEAGSPSWLVADRGVVKVGDEAPNFQLRDLAGNMVSLSQLRGKVVLVNFWATWC
ncbi:MAG: redoxin domain-containing protein, partial [Nitrospirota bacterium]